VWLLNNIIIYRGDLVFKKCFLIIFSLVICAVIQASNNCPISQQISDEIEINNESQMIKDLGTDIVVNEFFSTPDTLFNFMSLVYNGIHARLEEYKNKQKLTDKSIFLLLKKNNILRMVAQGVFEQVGPEVREILEDTYDADFKRSHADFSVYIDAKKLGGIKYNKVFDDISKLVFAELGKIRLELLAHPKKYFNFMQLEPAAASRELEKYFTELNQLPIVEDSKNQKWYDAKFTQLQLLDARANKDIICSYIGQVDYRFDVINNKIVGTPLSTKTRWIANTEKKIKFGLVSSEVVFEYIFEKDGETIRKPIGGKLIDVSIREFVDNYNQNIAAYNLSSLTGEEKIIIKAYSLKYLAARLQAALFNSFNRPHEKRINEIFFLILTQLLGTYGTGSEKSKEYIKYVTKQLLQPLEKIYPVNNNSHKVASEIQEAAREFSERWPDMVAANNFWQALANFVVLGLDTKPEAEDSKGFEKLLEAINRNVKIINKLNMMAITKIIPEKIYETDIKKLF